MAEEVQSAIYLFNSKCLEFEELFKQDGLPDPKARNRALKYLRGFYKTINTPQQLEKRIYQSCRQYSSRFVSDFLEVLGSGFEIHIGTTINIIALTNHCQELRY